MNKRLHTTLKLIAAAALVSTLAHHSHAQVEPCADSSSADAVETLVGQVPAGSPCKVAALPDAKRNPVHSGKPLTVDGPYDVTDDALANTFHGAPRDGFFGYTITLPDGNEIFVQDMRYDLGGDKRGYRPIPVNDNGNVTAPDGSSVGGSQVMDDYLRKVMGLGPDDQIWALTVFNHPEKFKGGLDQAAGDDLRTEMGQTHMGSYLGSGYTINSPENYMRNVWGVKGYPTALHVVSMDGTDQATLNRNAEQWGRVMNDGVKFPGDYKNDAFYTSSLAKVTDFAMRWVNGDQELRTNADLFTYCAEHQTIITNLATNYPLNREFFKQTFGDDEGAKFFDTVAAKYKAATGKDLVEIDMDKFGKPLFQRSGITDPKSATKPGEGMAWPPEGTSDLLVNFVETYTPFVEAGGVMTTAAIVGFRDTVNKRMGLEQNVIDFTDPNTPTSAPAGFDDDAFLKIAVPMINKVQIADALAADLDSPEKVAAFAKQRTGELFVAFGGPQDALPAVLQSLGDDGRVDPSKLAAAGIPADKIKAIAGAWGLATASVAAFQDPENVQLIVGCAGQVSRTKAWTWLRQSLAKDLEKSRNLPVANGKTRYYSPPAVTHRIAHGMHPAAVTITEVATAFDHSELELKGTGAEFTYPKVGDDSDPTPDPGPVVQPEPPPVTEPQDPPNPTTPPSPGDDKPTASNDGATPPPPPPSTGGQTEKDG